MLRKIALTGGPCAGKSSAMEYLKKEFEKFGYKVIIMPEAATQIINEGMKPGTKNFQLEVFKRQLELEEAANSEAMEYNRVIVFYDRSLYDQLAYVDEEIFKEFCDELKISKIDSRYNGIIHLVSAAIGTTAYTTSNNAARQETREEAIELEEKTLKATKHYRGMIEIVDNSTDFNGKLKRVFEAAIRIFNQW